MSPLGADMTDKTNAQIEFAKQALREALDRMESELNAADEAAHKLVELESGDPDEFRIMELGNLVDWTSHMCTPQIKLLGGIAAMLHKLHEGEERESDESAICH
jgi:hypothetical protein